MKIRPSSYFYRLQLTLIICCCGSLLFAQRGLPVREKININREWKFFLGDQPGAQQVNYADKQWVKVNLPHSFSTPFFQTGQWYTGYGWYRKTFDVKDNWRGKRVFIEFEGAFRDAEVFVNGRAVGHHRSGYTGFSYDITDAIVKGRNVLAVRLNNLWNARLAPRSGDHIFPGGIYRDVYLVVTNPAHVTWYGTFVTTPKVSKLSGVVNVKTEVTNNNKSAKSFVLLTTIVDPAGKVADSFSTSMKIGAGATVSFDQTGKAISNPKLWAPGQPYLYKAVSRLYDGATLADQYETTFGFRWMEWTADKGFFLNGEHYYFKGANVHQDHAGWANAVTNQGFVRDIKLVKEAGFDFIRGSHYPHDPAFSEACDSLGMLFWSENNFWSSGGFSKEGSWYDKAGAYPIHPEDQDPFEINVKESLRDMIRIHRNHPSIIVWSMGNENFFTEKSTLPKVKLFLKDLVALTHELDPGRKAAVGGVQRGGLDSLGDVAGYNGDGARLFLNPGFPNVVSEYSSTMDVRPGKYFPGWGDLQQEQFAWRSGQVLWCAFDYGTHLGEGKFGYMGMLDYYRLPKRMWYWYRNEYRHIPPPVWPENGIAASLSLTADKTTINKPDGTDDVQLIVTVMDKAGNPVSNCPDVTLKLESGPGEFPTGDKIVFSATSDIAIRDGKAAIEFRSYYGGKSVIRATSPDLKDALITITTQGKPEFIPGKMTATAYQPYVRYQSAEKTDLTTNNKVNIIYQKPTKASSEAEGHSAGRVNDQQGNTYWSPIPNQKENWWQVDMESLTSVSRVNLTFPEPGIYSYRIEVTLDGINWTPVYSSPAVKQTAKQTITIAKSPPARFLRIKLATPANGKAIILNEAEVYGKSN